MKEFEFTFDKGLYTGLRKHFTNPRNEQALVELHNWMPTEAGLVVHEAVTDLDADGTGGVGSDFTWDGLGEWTPGTATRNITLRITDYIDLAELEDVSVTIDSVYKGLTDADGELDISNIATGGHTLLLTKTGYLDSDADTLLNDYFVVT